MADLKGRQNNASELRNREALIITELIDTKWDVNEMYGAKGDGIADELIDT